MIRCCSGVVRVLYSILLLRVGIGFCTREHGCTHAAETGRAPCSRQNAGKDSSRHSFRSRPSHITATSHFVQSVEEDTPVYSCDFLSPG